MRATTFRRAGSIRRTVPARSSTDQSEPSPIQRLYGPAAPVSIFPVTRPLLRSRRETTPPESSDQTAPSPAITAIGKPPTGVERSEPDESVTRTTRPSSLQATQAVPPVTASVAVGQYGPAPSHAF